MNAKQVYSFKDTLNKEGILFCYSGFMTEQILTGIAQALKSKLAIDETEKTVAKGLFSILVEQVQNVIRYSAEFEPPGNENPELRYGILIVACQNNKYNITCGNLVKKGDETRLQGNLNEIKAMDKAELKARYKEMLKGEPPEGSKGASVGFLDIARRARRGFDFDFYPVDEHHSYFSLIAHV